MFTFADGLFAACINAICWDANGDGLLLISRVFCWFSHAVEKDSGMLNSTLLFYLQNSPLPLVDLPWTLELHKAAASILHARTGSVRLVYVDQHATGATSSLLFREFQSRISDWIFDHIMLPTLKAFWVSFGQV